MYTNDAKSLGQELSRDVSKSTALQPELMSSKIEPQQFGTHVLGLELRMRG
jgi:hypothetical protein